MAGAPFGNNNGAKTKRFLDAVERACVQDDGKRLRAAAEQLLTLAASGEQWAVRELADRLDGKPSQSLTVNNQPEMTQEEWGAELQRRAEVARGNLARLTAVRGSEPADTSQEWRH